MVFVSTLAFRTRTSNKYKLHWSQSGRDGGPRGRHKFNGTSERNKTLWLEEPVKLPGGGCINNGS